MFDKAKFYILLALLNAGLNAGCTLDSDEARCPYPSRICEFISVLKRGDFSNNAILLHGPTGSGKTRLYQLMARELNAHLIVIETHDLVTEFAGGARSGVQAYVEKAKKFVDEDGRPVMFACEEVDAIAHTITSQTQSLDSQRTDALQSLWRTIEKYGPNNTSEDEDAQKYKNKFIWACNTNGRSRVDDALLNRIQTHVELPLPDAKKREHMIKFYLKSRNLDKYFNQAEISDMSNKMESLSLRVMEGVIRTAASQITPECSFKKEDLYKLITEAKTNFEAKKKEEASAQSAAPKVGHVENFVTNTVAGAGRGFGNVVGSAVGVCGVAYVSKKLWDKAPEEVKEKAVELVVEKGAEAVAHVAANNPAVMDLLCHYGSGLISTIYNVFSVVTE